MTYSGAKIYCFTVAYLYYKRSGLVSFNVNSAYASAVTSITYHLLQFMILKQVSSAKYSSVILNSLKCVVASGVVCENIYLFLSYKKAVTLDRVLPFVQSLYSSSA